MISYTNERIDLFVAEGLTHVGAKLDAGEFLEIVTMTDEEMLAALDRGEITDAKTVAALLLYARRRRAMIARRLVDPRAACRASAIATRWSRPRARCGVAGWVRNRRDGTVEAFVQGDAAAVDGDRRVVPARSAGGAGRRRRSVARRSRRREPREFTHRPTA